MSGRDELAEEIVSRLASGGLLWAIHVQESRSVVSQVLDERARSGGPIAGERTLTPSDMVRRVYALAVARGELRAALDCAEWLRQYDARSQSGTPR